MVSALTLMMALSGLAAAQDIREANIVFCSPLLKFCGDASFKEGLKETPLLPETFDLGCRRAMTELETMCGVDSSACPRMAEMGKFRIFLWGMQARNNRIRDLETCLRWFQTGESVGARR
jgi:hypothetical protein